VASDAIRRAREMDETSDSIDDLIKDEKLFSTEDLAINYM
jgi:hypothetical protein